MDDIKVGDIVRNKVDHERFGYDYTGIVLKADAAGPTTNRKSQVLWIMRNPDSQIIDWEFSKKLKLADG